MIARFIDKNTNVWLELFTSKIPEPPKPAHQRARNWTQLEGTETKEDTNGTHRIKRDHLKGRARSLSEGAIVRLKTFHEEDEELTPSKPVQIKTMKKSPSLKW